MEGNVIPVILPEAISTGYVRSGKLKVKKAAFADGASELELVC